MKHIFLLVLAMAFCGSLASANCPQNIPTGTSASLLVKNYDGTCTVRDPELNDRGYRKKIAAETDDACELFGFGAKSGVDQERYYQLPRSEEKTIRLGKFDSGSEPARNVFHSITCRMSK